MSILKKNKEVDSKEEFQNDEGVKNMTYTDLASQDLTNRMDKLIKEKKRIENCIRESLEDIKERGSSSNGLAEIVFNLREREKDIQKQIDHTSQEYAVDLQLMNMAFMIDRAESENKGMDLIYEIGNKVNEIISMFPEIEKCYGSDFYTPSSYSVTKRIIEGLCMSLNNELPKLHKIDKKVLIQKFNERMAILNKNKKIIEADKNKYKLML